MHNARIVVQMIELYWNLVKEEGFWNLIILMQNARIVIQVIEVMLELDVHR